MNWRRRSTRSWPSFASPGRTRTEVERARNVIETRTVQGLETLGGFSGLANRLNSYNHFLGDPGYLAKDIQRYRDVTPESVKAFAGQELAPTARVVVQGVPGTPNLGAPVPTPKQAATPSGAGAESINADEAWRSPAARAWGGARAAAPGPDLVSARRTA